jgi:hypothetical protein
MSSGQSELEFPWLRAGGTESQKRRQGETAKGEEDEANARSRELAKYRNGRLYLKSLRLGREREREAKRLVEYDVYMCLTRQSLLLSLQDS